MGYLISDGVNDVVSLPAGSTSNVGTTTYTWWIKGTLRTAPSGLAGILGTSSVSASSGFATNATLQLRVYSAGTNRYGTGDNFFEVGVYHHYRLEHDAGGAWRAYRDDMVTPVVSGTFTGSFTFAALNQMFRSSSASTMWSAWDMEEMGITSTTFSETYQADLSGGTGSVLPTVSGNNNGTLVNFPTDNSQWGGFGATYTLTAQGGTYSYSGDSAGLNRGYKLEAQGSTYSYSGASANLTYNTALVYRMNALGVSYSYAGASTSLLRGFKLAANGGAYSYAGGDAALTKSGPMVYRLTALGVTYIYSGATATLTTTGVIPAANPAAFVNRAYVGGSQVINAQVGGRMVNNAKIGGSLTNNAMVAI